MDKHIIHGAEDYLEEARLKSKRFYIKATQNAVEAACEMSEQSGNSAQEALEYLKKYVDSGEMEFGNKASAAAQKAAELAALAAKAAQEASEATQLAISTQETKRG